MKIERRNCLSSWYRDSPNSRDVIGCLIEILSREPFRERGVDINKPSKKQLSILKPKKLQNYAIKTEKNVKNFASFL